MTKNELVNFLKKCSNGCDDNCPYHEMAGGPEDCMGKLMDDAANALQSVPLETKCVT